MKVDFRQPGFSKRPWFHGEGIHRDSTTIDNVDAAFQRALIAGAVSLKEPTKKPRGQIVSYVRDLNGFLVEICSPMP